MTWVTSVYIASFAIVLGCSGDDGGGDDGSGGAGGSQNMAAGGSAGTSVAGGAGATAMAGGAGSPVGNAGAGGEGPSPTNEDVAEALVRGCATAKQQCPSIDEADCAQQYVFEGDACFGEYAAYALCVADISATDVECTVTGASPKPSVCPTEAGAYSDCAQ